MSIVHSTAKSLPKSECEIGADPLVIARMFDYNGSPDNLRIEWDSGEITDESLNIIEADDPVSCAIYSRENILLDEPG